VLNLTELIDWSKCSSGRVPVIIQGRPGWILGVFWIPKTDVQAIADLNAALRRCHRSESSGLYIDCDNDVLLCRCDSVTQELLWDRCLPTEMAGQRYDWRVSKELLQTQKLWEKTYDGLLPAIVQDAASHDFLMLAWMNQEAWEDSMQSQRMCFFSRSKNRLWRKGEESGNRQVIQEAQVCVGGGMPHTLLFRVEQLGGAACHDGYKSCFFRRIDTDQFTTVGERVFDPQQVYKK